MIFWASNSVLRPSLGFRFSDFVFDRLRVFVVRLFPSITLLFGHLFAKFLLLLSATTSVFPDLKPGAAIRVCRPMYRQHSSETSMDTAGTAPRLPSITVIGWTTVIASAIMIVVNAMSLLSFTMLDTLDLNVNMPLVSQYVPQSMKKVMDLYRYSRWWTGYGILFFGFALVAGFQFLRFRAWGRKALEIACWIGLANAVVDSTLSYAIWKNMQDTLSMALRGLGGGQYSYINPLGFVTIVVGFFLWIIPSVGMIIYLRRPAIRQAASLD